MTFLLHAASVASVFSISFLVGHLSIQSKFPAALRIAVVAGWLILLAVVGAGDVWLTNVAALVGLWLLDFVYGKATRTRGLAHLLDEIQTEDASQTVATSVRATFSVGVTIAIAVSYFCLGSRAWSFSGNAPNVSLLLVAMLGLLGYFLTVKAVSCFRKEAGKALLWGVPAVAAIVVTPPIASLTFGILPLQHIAIYAVVGLLSVIFWLVVLLAQRGLAGANIPMVLLVVAALAVTGWQSFQLFQYRTLAGEMETETQSGNNLDENLASEIVAERLKAQEHITNLFLARWKSDTSNEDTARLREMAEGVLNWEHTKVSRDFKQSALEDSFQRPGGWTHAASFLLNGDEGLSQKALLLQIAHDRFLAVCRLERVRIAVKLAEFEHGKTVRSLAELSEVNGFEIPEDPFGRGRPLSEKTVKDRWLIYSLSDDALDSSGTELSTVGEFEGGGYVIDKWIGDIVLTIE